MRLKLSAKFASPVISLALSSMIVFSADFLYADTIYLKNKSHIDGFIESENGDTVVINLGYGTSSFLKSEIERIDRSDKKENQQIWDQWGEEKKDIEKRKPEEEEKWRKRQAELDRIRQEQEALKKEKDEFGPKTVKAVAKNGQMIMSVLINNETRLNLVLDSGAGMIVLSRKAADRLHLDVDKLKKSRAQVADGRWVEMGATKLLSVGMQNVDQSGKEPSGNAGIEVKDVDASVVLDEAPDKNMMEDGLLGMSFLKNFRFNADYKNERVVFERIKPGEGVSGEPSDKGKPRLETNT